MNQEMYQNNQSGCGCPKNPCKITPIVLPQKVCCVHRYFCVEQPVIVPNHTRVINHFVPTPRYYPTFTTSEEDVCGGGLQNNAANADLNAPR